MLHRQIIHNTYAHRQITQENTYTNSDTSKHIHTHTYLDININTHTPTITYKYAQTYAHIRTDTSYTHIQNP